MARPHVLRNPEATDAIAAANVDDAALVAAGNAATELAIQRDSIRGAAEAEFNIGTPYDLQLFIAIARNDAQQADMYLVRLGFVLSQIHANENAETYADAVEQIGISTGYATRLRAAAMRLNDRKPLLALGRTKALELLSEDDATLDALVDGGVVAGHTLDEIDRMSVRELKDALRTERRERADDKTATDELMRDKDERINKLMRNKRKLETSSVRAQVEELLHDMDEAAIVLAQQAVALVRGIADVRSAYDGAGEKSEPEVEARIRQNIELAAQWLRELAAALGE